MEFYTTKQHQLNILFLLILEGYGVFWSCLFDAASTDAKKGSHLRGMCHSGLLCYKHVTPKGANINIMKLTLLYAY
ncbi:MAG: hypothetical protein IPL13_17310 [Saprospiraceae bacterium]|uniref:hypothetical protein n=1 Tax=Candidatus Brachybacter algidus TaxID=2982024 RepID=UPI001B639EE9|nr:hypothetical protein [Candidatus Brachybacter algidus]MBP7305720.1 hypothetical protein [Saprospiraceae bacterium]MBK6371943.1 hypothetical protein [Candidatus Brachybacter algidus]MBK6448734.1 hypothetical protein [Candidatus Brachybacter algidus]MBK8357055.1 hypothetical protein [Candidatus Brachybacter algidus]MBK8843118.1 hypothetical protein [Candidatus Brachybacter algidus]